MAEWAMALTFLFTLGVFTFEHYLDKRQAQSYQKTEFPVDLETIVRKVDKERDETGDKDNDGEDDKKAETNSTFDKDKPILPQLKSKFDQAQSYGSDRMTFGMIHSLYSLIETVLSLLLGALPYFWDLSIRLGEHYFGWSEAQHEIKITLIFCVATSLIGTLTSLPWDLYSTFRIEKRHGFNNQTLGLFFSDMVKSMCLSFVIGGPVVALLLEIIRWGGKHFYIYAWAFTSLISFLMMTFVPVVIMPLFNKYEPLKDGELKNKIHYLAERLHYPLKHLYVMDGSKRSSHSNAFLFGFGNKKRIVLFDTLLDQVDNDEIVAILGHELGHWKLGHTIINFCISQIYFAAVFYCFSQCYNSNDLYYAFGFDDPSRPIPIAIAMSLFFQTLWSPVDKIISFMTTLHSRKCEFEADDFSVKLGMGQKLQTALCKMSMENLGAMCPDRYYAMYHYSHPPIVQRISALIASNKKYN